MLLAGHPHPVIFGQPLPVFFGNYFQKWAFNQLFLRIFDDVAKGFVHKLEFSELGNDDSVVGVFNQVAVFLLALFQLFLHHFSFGEVAN